MGILDLGLIVLGLYALVPKLYWIYISIINSFFLTQKDLKKLYNENGDSWVLVTGCTSGIGEEIAHRFAKLGFNIVLLSRSIERLNSVDQAVKKHSPKVKTRIVQADFANGGEKLELYERIYEEVKDLDISILVNNAGVLHNGYFRDLTVKQVTEQVIVNTYPYILLTKALLP